MKWNEEERFSYDQANEGHFFVLFECTQYAHLMHLRGLYPWTINLFAMYNMRVSVMPLFLFQEGEMALCTWVQKWHFLMLAWHEGTTSKAITAGKHTNLKTQNNIKYVPQAATSGTQKHIVLDAIKAKNKKKSETYLWRRWWWWNKT